MGFGLYLQHVQNLEPCPLCILQRYAFVVIGVDRAGRRHPRSGARGQRDLRRCSSSWRPATGAAIAGRQTWLQHNPPNVLDCGPDLAYMLDSFPLAQVLPKIFKGEGDCAKVTWKFLGLSIPEWALVWFALFVLAGLYLLIVRRRRGRLTAAAARAQGPRGRPMIRPPGARAGLSRVNEPLDWPRRRVAELTAAPLPTPSGLSCSDDPGSRTPSRAQGPHATARRAVRHCWSLLLLGVAAAYIDFSWHVVKRDGSPICATWSSWVRRPRRCSCSATASAHRCWPRTCRCTGRAEQPGSRARAVAALSGRRPQSRRHLRLFVPDGTLIAGTAAGVRRQRPRMSRTRCSGRISPRPLASDRVGDRAGALWRAGERLDPAGARARHSTGAGGCRSSCPW